MKTPFHSLAVSQSICNVATFNPPQTKEIRKLFINSLLGVRKQVGDEKRGWTKPQSSHLATTTTHILKLMLQTHPKCIQPGFVVTSKMLALFDVDSLLPSSLTVLSAAVSSRSRKIVLPTSRQEATKAFFDDIYATLLLVSRLCSESVEEVEEEGGDREPDISSHLPPPVEQENLPPVVLQSAEKQMRHESRVEKQQQQQHNIISQLTSSSSNFNMVVVDPLIKHQTSTVIASREEENEEEQVNQRLPQQESPDLISSSSLQQQFNDDDHIIVARPKPFKKHDLTSSSSSKPPASAPAAKSAATSSKKSHALLKKQQSQEQQQQIKTTDYEFTSITHQDQFCPACCRMCACEPLTEKDWIFKLRSRMPRETIEAIVRQLTAREEEEGEIEEEKDAEEIQMVEEDMVKEQQMDDQDEIMQVFDDGDVNDQVEELVEEVSSPSPPPLSKRKSSVQPRENNGDEEVLAKKKKNKTNSNVIITKNVIKRGNKNMLLVREPKWLDADCLASILGKYEKQSRFFEVN